MPMQGSGTAETPMANVPQRILRAAASQGVTALAAKVINFACTIALARLLFPEDYGLFTIAMVITGLASLVSHFGFQTYVIQAKEIDAQTLNTCYALNMLLSALLGLAVALTGLLWTDAPPLLPLMLGLYGLQVFLSGLTYIQLALFKRDLDFSTSSRIELEYTAVSMLARVGFAWASLGGLAFPLGDLAGSVVRWLRVRRRSRHVLRIERVQGPAARAATAFGLHSTSLGLATFTSNQVDKMLLSISQTPAGVGLYSFGNSTAAMFHNALIVPQTSVFLAGFARMRETPEAARKLLAASSRLIFSLALPANVLWIIETKRMVQAIFGERWLAAAPVIQVFAFAFLVRSLFSGVTGLQLSFGLASQAARTKWLNAGVFATFLGSAALAKVGIVGYALAFLAADLITIVHNMHVNGKLLQINWPQYLRNLLPPAVIALASTAMWAAARPYLDSFGLWPSLLALAATWLVCYTALSLAFNRVAFEVLWRLLSHRMERHKR